MQRPPLETIAERLAEQLQCEHVRATFCEQSLFFESEQAASTWLAAHPEAVLFSITEAAVVGKKVAASRFTKKNDSRKRFV